MKIQLTEQEIVDAIKRFVIDELGDDNVENITVECDYDCTNDSVRIMAVYVDVL